LEEKEAMMYGVVKKLAICNIEQNVDEGGGRVALHTRKIEKEA
jgi:hypothetical protein